MSNCSRSNEGGCESSRNSNVAEKHEPSECGEDGDGDAEDSGTGSGEEEEDDNDEDDVTIGFDLAMLSM